MFLNINKAIYCIGNPNIQHNTWYNINDGELYSYDEIEKIISPNDMDENDLYLKGFIPFFEYPMIEIEKEFIKSLNDKRLEKKMLNLPEEKFGMEFGYYVRVNRALNSRWLDYEAKRLAELLIDWCNYNNIKYRYNK